MQLSFQETMQGHWLDQKGHEYPVLFTVAASGGAGGRFALRGVIEAPPWAPRAAVQGSLTMEPWLRAIRYHLTFTAQDGQVLTLTAHKTPSPRHPVNSMTLMPATLQDASGRTLASGRMAFLLRDLPGFVWSWLPVRGRARRQLDAERRSLERQVLAGT